MADVTSDIRGFNTPPHIETKDSNARIVGAAIIILALASAGAYSYESGRWHSTPKQAVPASELPAPSEPQPLAQPAPLPAAVNTTPAPSVAPTPMVAPAPAPVATTTTTVRTPDKIVRTRIVSHGTVVHRSQTERQTNAPVQSDVAPQNSGVNNTPDATVPAAPAPTSTMAPSTTPAAPSQSVAPTQAPVQAAPQTATPQPTPSESTPNSSNTTPNATDQSNTPSPQ